MADSHLYLLSEVGRQKSLVQCTCQMESKRLLFTSHQMPNLNVMLMMLASNFPFLHSPSCLFFSGPCYSLTIFFVVYTSIIVHPTARTVNEGYSSLNLTCNADGNPMPSFTWFKNVTFLVTTTSRFTFLSNGKVLQITMVSRTDAGNYFCRASNGRNASSQIAALLVNCKFYAYSCLISFNLFSVKCKKTNRMTQKYLYQMSSDRMLSVLKWAG